MESANSPEKTENVIYRTTKHWAALLGPAMLLILGGVSVRSHLISSLVMIVVAVIWGILSVRSIRSSEFILTESKLVIKTGFLFQHVYELPYIELANADFFKPALGFMMGFGKLMIVKMDKKAIVFRLVAKPDDFAERLRKEIIKAHEAAQAGDTTP